VDAQRRAGGLAANGVAPAGARPDTDISESPTLIQPALQPSDDDGPETARVIPLRPGAADAPPTVQIRPAPTPPGVRIRLASIGWGLALLFVVASGLFVFTWSATGPHASVEVEAAAWMSGGQVMSLVGTGVRNARARFVVVDGGRRAELAVDGLPPLAAGRVYQVWFAEPGQPSRTGGAFLVDPRGDAIVRVTMPVPLERVRAIAVTQEPAPGVASPTGVNLLNWPP